MKHILSIITALIMMIFAFSESSLARITLIKTREGVIKHVETHTQGTRMYFLNLMSEAKEVYVEVQINLDKKIPDTKILRQQKARERQEEAEKKGKKYVPREETAPDEYTLTFNYSARDVTRQAVFAKKFFSGGVEIEFFLDDKPLRIEPFVKAGDRVPPDFTFVKSNKYNMTEKELTAIVNATKFDYKITNTRGQSIGCYITDEALAELREFCTKYAGVKAEEKPLAKRTEPIKISGFEKEAKASVGKEVTETETPGEEKEAQEEVKGKKQDVKKEAGTPTIGTKVTTETTGGEAQEAVGKEVEKTKEEVKREADKEVEGAKKEAEKEIEKKKEDIKSKIRKKLPF